MIDLYQSWEKAVNPLKRRFWKAQIDVLRAVPPLLGIVSGRSLGADKSLKIWTKTMLQTAVQAPGALFLHWRNRREGRVALPRVSFVVATRCTLNCDKCVAHMPDLKNKADAPLPVLLDDIHRLLACVDAVYDINISGGEAFLRPDLDRIVEAIAETGKVSDINVTTNGTVIPDGKVLAALKAANVTVKISRYPLKLQPEAEQLKRALEQHGVRYTHESGAFWRDTADLAFRRKTGGLPPVGNEAARRRFSGCIEQLGLPYLGGKLYLCCESAILAHEGIIPAGVGDCIDLRATSPAAFGDQWRKLLERRAVSACAWCGGYTNETRKVPVAVQREPRGRE